MTAHAPTIKETFHLAVSSAVTRKGDFANDLIKTIACERASVQYYRLAVDVFGEHLAFAAKHFKTCPPCVLSLLFCSCLYFV